MNRWASIVLGLVAVLSGVVPATAKGKADHSVIVVDRADDSIFPESWLKDPVSASAVALPEAERDGCRQLIEAELAKYPAAVLEKNLTRVHLLARLHYYGVATGGTRSARVVYVVKNGRIPPALFVNNFHAEFSSILLRNHRKAFDEAAWQAANPSGFAYRGSGVAAVKDGLASTKLSEERHAEGFLNDYAKASLEEDFNSFAGRLFTGDPALWEAIGRFPKIADKAEVAMAFYASIDSAFSRGFFEGLRREP